MRGVWGVVLGAVVMAGCGGSDPGKGVSGELDRRLKHAAELGTGATYRGRVHADGTSKGQPLRMDGIAAQSADGKRILYRGSMSAEGERFRRVTMLNVGDDTYFQGRRFAPLLTGGKRWVHVGGGGTPTLSVRQFFDVLRTSDGTRAVGRERLHGRQALHVRTRTSAGEIAAPLGVRAGDLPMRIDVWLDDRDRVARLAVDVGKDASDRVAVSFDIREYGIPVPKARPTARVVYDAD